VIGHFISSVNMNPLAVPAGDRRFDAAFRAEADYASVDNMESGQCSSAMRAGVKLGRLLAFGDVAFDEFDYVHFVAPSTETF
jgi:hypothetical protein